MIVCVPSKCTWRSDQLVIFPKMLNGRGFKLQKFMSPHPGAWRRRSYFTILTKAPPVYLISQPLVYGSLVIARVEAGRVYTSIPHIPLGVLNTHTPIPHIPLGVLNTHTHIPHIPVGVLNTHTPIPVYPLVFFKLAFS